MKEEQSVPPSFNPWPYSIVAFFAVAILAAVVWVGFCIRNGSDLVAGDYYDQELEHQAQMERVERTLALGDAVSLNYDAAADRIDVKMPVEQARLAPEGVIHLYRPSQSDLDRVIALEVNAAGEQHLDASVLEAGLWEVRVKWSAGGEEYYMSQKIRVRESVSTRRS